MLPQIIYLHNKLILPPTESKSKYYTFLTGFFIFLTLSMVVICFVLDANIYVSLFVFLLQLPLFFLVKDYWLGASRHKQIIIEKFMTHLQINRKKMIWEDLMFLSIREKELYNIIRLEAKRKNMLIANEVVLINNCASFDEAVHLCRQFRDFIDPNLKINVATNYISRSGGKSDLENWHYIE